MASLLPLATATTASPAAQADAASQQAVAFPGPGDHFASPTTRLTFRYVSPSAVAGAAVVGSVSGQHAGTVVPLAAGGAAFVPREPFAPGEEVTVRVAAPVLDAPDGRFTFQVARPVPPTVTGPPAAPPAPCPSPRYKSRPDLVPAGACLTAGGAGGDKSTLLLAVAGDGPTIYTAGGEVVWHQPVAGDTMNLSMVSAGGRRLLAYFTGQPILAGGAGRGHYVLLDDHYRQVGVVAAGNGYQADEHELQVTSQGTALLGAFNPVHLTVDGQDVTVDDYVVQEVDLRDHDAVLFEWHSLDHVPVQASHLPVPAAGADFDYFHGNAVEVAPDGNLLISSRNTWGVYDVDRHDGHVIWTLGTPADGSSTLSLTDPTGLGFCYQHDVRAADSRTLTLFDDGGAGPGCGHPARALTIRLDPAARTAKVISVLSHVPGLTVQYTGSFRPLADGGHVVSWGDTGVVTDYAHDGTLREDLTLGQFSYRTVPAAWQGYPQEAPAVAVDGGQAFVSWNGATQVAAWRLLGGPGLRPIGQPVPKLGFETALPIPSGVSQVEVQALAADGQPLAGGTSAPVAVGSTQSTAP